MLPDRDLLATRSTTSKKRPSSMQSRSLIAIVKFPLAVFYRNPLVYHAFYKPKDGSRTPGFVTRLVKGPPFGFPIL